MTTLFEHQHDGPSTHALVVGIGVYSHCGPGASLPAAELVRDLTSPQLSAHTFARHLIDSQGDLEAPLGTVTLLADPVHGGFAAPTPPTFDNVRTAMRAWQGRGRSNDCLILYWCGHGFETDDSKRLLLCSDVGENGEFWDRTVDNVADFYRAHASPARTQLWLIDACREHAARLKTFDPRGRTTLADVGRDVLAGLQGKDASAVLAANLFAQAGGDSNAPSHFCAALIDTIKWRAYDRRQGAWQIRTLDLATEINQYFLEHGIRQTAHPHDGIGRHAVWSRVSPPQVPASFQCDPVLVRNRVRLELDQIDQQNLSRTPFGSQNAPSLSPWKLTVPAGWFSLRGRDQVDSTQQERSFPVSPKDREGVLIWGL